ncbi:MAG: hypothetical protein J6T16_02775 [Opitutales bacterium]|nr:hypothetical protein [Opitutales bacterium]
MPDLSRFASSELPGTVPPTQVVESFQSPSSTTDAASRQMFADYALAAASANRDVSSVLFIAGYIF